LASTMALRKYSGDSLNPPSRSSFGSHSSNRFAFEIIRTPLLRLVLWRWFELNLVRAAGHCNRLSRALQNRNPIEVPILVRSCPTTALAAEPIHFIANIRFDDLTAVMGRFHPAKSSSRRNRRCSR
jgi:hypothetical protein